jgi:hypothetical protein
MALVAKVEGNSVILYKVPGNQRDRRISGWPDQEKVTSAIVTESTLTVTFNNGKVRCYNPENGQCLGVY